MSETPERPSWQKRILRAIGGLVAFILLFVLALRITVVEMFRSIEQNRATGLSSVASWDTRSMWQSSEMPAGRAVLGPIGGSEISRSADLRMRSSAFDDSVANLQKVVSAHHGYLEDLRTESRSGAGRALAAMVTVPSAEFDSSLSDLKALGRIEAISEAGEDSAVKLAMAARRLASAQTNLSRLQKLQRERRGELRDAVALEKDIAQANEAVAESERLHTALLSTVVQARIHVALVEDFRAPFEAHFAEAALHVRNSFVDGLGGIFQSVALVVGVFFEYGLPLLFWGTILLYPARVLWRRFRARPPATVSA
ncbi:MAG TPA: DUF4349 domain-containing protein [Candidatus Acidoferrum sp.]|nr:DUF4349 domain-containing protein [Candidatus Acidoferrum sp.]